MAVSTAIRFKNPKLKKAFEAPDEWIGISTKKPTSVRDDQISVRPSLSANKKSSSLQITMGKDIHELLGWKVADYIAIQQSRIRPYLLRLIKTDITSHGYKLGFSVHAPTKLYMKFRIDGTFIYDSTAKVEYDIENDGLIIDMTDVLA